MDETKKHEAGLLEEPSFWHEMGPVLMMMSIAGVMATWRDDGPVFLIFSRLLVVVGFILITLHEHRKGKQDRSCDTTSSFRKAGPIFQGFTVFFAILGLLAMLFIFVMMSRSLVLGEALQSGASRMIEDLLSLIASVLGIRYLVRFLRWYRRNCP